MLMNSNELILSINKRLQDSGIIDDITDFFHEHPEYFSKCINGDRHIICTCDINITMCCTPSKRPNDNVFVNAYLGSYNSVYVSLHDHSRDIGSKINLERGINGKEVSSYVCN